MKLILSCLLLVLPVGSFAQGSPPWESPLKMAWSTDGTTFTNISIYQDSSGVPSVVRWKGDTLACVFQWFRKPINSTSWDKVAVKFSYNAGTTWTKPVPIIVNGLPAGYQRPFDPTLAVINSGSLRIYFSSGDGLPVGGLDAGINTYSGISNDGVNYTFEPNPRFDHPTTRVIDPAVIYFNGAWHYVSPIGAPQDGAYHATSNNGLDFFQQSNFSSDMTHNWTGNFMLNAPGELRFYGSGPRMWHNSSSDGSIWQGFVSTNIIGGDPTVVRISSSQFLAIYVGQRYVTGIENNGYPQELAVYPNPFSDYIALKGDQPIEYDYWLYSVTGSLVLSGKKHSDNNIPTVEIGKGVYLLMVKTLTETKVFKLIK